jgi:hypothetical protein
VFVSRGLAAAGSPGRPAFTIANARVERGRGRPPSRDDPLVQPDLRLDPEGLDAAAGRAAMLAADLEVLARHAGQSIGHTDLPEILAEARTILSEAAVVLRRTAVGLGDADRAAARGFAGPPR